MKVSGKVQGAQLSIAALALCASATDSAFAQGCIVARGAGMTSTHAAPGNHEQHEGAGGGLELSVAYRYLHSERPFVGTTEIHNAPDVDINRSHFIDVALRYSFNDRYSATLTIPYATHERSSVAKNSQGAIVRRFSTHNSGLADLRLTGNMWLFDPKTSAAGNILLGLGIELPTGEEDARDTFPTFDRARGQLIGVRHPVDQSIQLSDGGYAALIDVFGYRQLTERASLFFTGFYSLTPEETNGVSTAAYTSNPFESEISIADSYAASAGVQYVLSPQHNLSVSLDARIEGVPVHDLVGGSDGFRRPGYAVSVEPGITAAIGSYALSLYAPIAVHRNRQQSVADRRLSQASGVNQHGAAAFADYLIMFNVSRSF